MEAVGRLFGIIGVMKGITKVHEIFFLFYEPRIVSYFHTITTTQLFVSKCFEICDDAGHLFCIGGEGPASDKTTQST